MLISIGNIFESKCNTIVNTVNCVGVMGKGIALEFKKLYPDMYLDYIQKCQDKILQPGKPYLYKNLVGKSILNFPTKNHWRSPSKLSYIIEGLDWFIENYEKLDIQSIAFPPLGCGNGGLTWDIVGPIMYQKLCNLPIEIEIYAPFGTRKSELTKEFLSKNYTSNEMSGKTFKTINDSWYLLLQVINELNKRQYSLKVGRTIYQKICYVLTRNGVNTGFKFTKGTYGPYSVQVKDSITILANANLIKEEAIGKMMKLSVTDLAQFNEEKYNHNELIAAKKTIDLFGRIKNSEQAEFIATVLYSYDSLKKEKNSISDQDVYNYVLQWKPRWENEKSYLVKDTIENLAMLSLINIKHNELFNL